MKKYNRKKDIGLDVACKKVWYAVKTGKLINLKENYVACVDCKKIRATEWEHRNYNKPLDVEPVCHSCNLQRGSAMYKITVTKQYNCIMCNRSDLRFVKMMCLHCYEYYRQKNKKYISKNTK